MGKTVLLYFYAISTSGFATLKGDKLLMRNMKLMTQARFFKQGEALSVVALPHTWNALDGQDGGADYWRGIGTYTIELPNPTKGMKQYIEFQGANHVATVYCNGRDRRKHMLNISDTRCGVLERDDSNDPNLRNH